MKVIDSFIFYNELKMLLFRLTEHNDFVDYFVLVEATKTFSGNPKRLYYQENKHLFEKFNHKIVHIIVDDMPDGEFDKIAWAREYHQRNSIDRGIQKITPDDTDVILISDVDEIFNYQYIQAVKTLSSSFGFQFNLVTYYYTLQHRCNEIFTSPRVLSYSLYKSLNSNPQIIRTLYIFQSIDNAGWHFSYFGDVHFIRNKLANFAHQELNNEADLDLMRIKDCIENAKDIARRADYRIDIIPIEQNPHLPRHYTMLL
jgi:hypothetical protein